MVGRDKSVEAPWEGEPLVLVTQLINRSLLSFYIWISQLAN